MAVTFNPTKIMTSDFYQENYSTDMGHLAKTLKKFWG